MSVNSSEGWDVFGGIKKRASTSKGNALLTIADENIHPLYSTKYSPKCKA